MSGQTGNDGFQYDVVVNDEGQYSVWPAHRPTPPGWRTIGVLGTREECLAHIRAVWTDMRPLSVRQAMEGGLDE